jgi:hypothetical protein
MEAAGRTLAAGREVVTIVGDPALLVPPLRAAGFEPELLAPPGAAAQR